MPGEDTCADQWMLATRWEGCGGLLSASSRMVVSERLSILADFGSKVREAENPVDSSKEVVQGWGSE